MSESPPSDSPKPGPHGDAGIESSIEPGDQLGKYRIGGRLGHGGMGVVHQAKDTFLKRQVAIKVLTKALSADRDTIRRFVLEARAFAKVNHLHAVQIYEVDRHRNVCYLVMELMGGGSIQDLLQREGKLDWPEATNAIADACRGLAATHAAGLVHRDVKPANLMRSSDGVVKLADFGTAREAPRADLDPTSVREIAGTPAYMSPEQCRNEPTDPASDLYSLGATYYALLTGSPPYTAESKIQVMFAHCSARIPDPRDRVPEIPEACAAIIQRAMAKSPRDRYPTAMDMLSDLNAMLTAGLRSNLAGNGIPADASGDAFGDSALDDLAAAFAETTETGLSLRTEPPEPSGNSTRLVASKNKSIDVEKPLATRRLGLRLSYGRVAFLACATWAAFTIPIAMRQARIAEVMPTSLRGTDGATMPVHPTSGVSVGSKPHPPSTAPRKPVTHPFITLPGGIPFGGKVIASGVHVASIAFASDGNRFAFACDGESEAEGVRVFDTRSGTPVAPFSRARGVRSVCFAPATPWMVAAGQAGLLARDGNAKWELIPEGGATGGAATAVTFSPDGKWLAAITAEPSGKTAVRLWEVTTWREVRRYATEGSKVFAIAFSRDGENHRRDP